LKKMIREVRVRDLWLYFALPLGLLLIASALITAIAVLLRGLLRLLALLPVIILLYFVLKYLAIGSVLMYKAFAPLDMRDACRFEPTCSTYMILSIKKYGLFRGVFRGIRRIMRCKPPNGGTDLP